MPDNAIPVIAYQTLLLGRHRHGPALRPGGGAALERSAVILLSRIQVQGPMSIRRLSEAFGLDASTVNRQANSMIRAGLLVRMPDPDAGMARLLRLTPEGARRLAEERAANARSLGRVLAAWTPEDTAVFAEFLTRFNQDIEALSGRPWPDPAAAPRT
ncbi:MarR family winged helix-turn-helix transcriptional regulator [Actinocorallia herbida]|uniref:MarR family winged helix-turn-helix transcriptional regulator n=1 Tax=Actinocorallia herbida TaxID=58109 RepID=UPI001FE88E2D|nr:MarR family winged helix-turn-helix transcriptional regulator [Actinocorallia herbida]